MFWLNFTVVGDTWKRSKFWRTKYKTTPLLQVNTLRLQENGRYFVDEIFKCMEFDTFCPTGDKSSVVQVIIESDSVIWPGPLVHIYVTKPQWACHSWWRHQKEAFSASLAICAGNSPVPGEFLAQRPVTRNFDVFFDLRPNNSWENNDEVADLRRHRAHYDVIVMSSAIPVYVWPLSIATDVPAPDGTKPTTYIHRADPMRDGVTL